MEEVNYGNITIEQLLLGLINGATNVNLKTTVQ
jgi:hypothetical protein